MAVNQEALAKFGPLVRTGWIRPLIVALIWLLLWRAASLMEYEPHASIWFPPAGVTFAIFLVLGWSYLPVLIVCCIGSTFWENSLYQAQQSASTLISTGLLFAAIHSCSYWVGATILKRSSERSGYLKVPHLILIFLLVAVLSSVLAALGGSAALALTGIISNNEIASLWVPWWIGDLIGVVVVTPIIVTLLGGIYPEEGRWLTQYFKPLITNAPLGQFLLKLATSMVMLTVISLLVAYYPSSHIVFTVFFLGIAQMWIVFTETATRSFLSLALLSTLTALLIAWLGLSEKAMVYQFTIYLLAANTYFGLWVPHILVDNQKLRRLSEQDMLTEVESRGYFIRNAKEEIVRAKRYNQPISLLLFDVDNFKAINDTYGHSVGDKVLTHIARLVDETIRASDKVGRFGGDEFMVLLPGDEEQQALLLAERLRHAVACADFDELDYPVTCSFGIAEVHENDTFSSAFEQADNCLLEAKRAGRNQVNA
ncbi:diguanylate cyclase [Vibrio sp. ABG19]|uniref:sensor domain-containing diguanylate cyclase n=1 Tax=Vibrio sp. ABG19 TaxID=2817385 RepID=UPI00249D9483|nr:diguanylate cyclase [Vibrio sp. ABG19]WGY44982.1 sensor domain-containing diguanylate cyclase [Vibrio sp. ABG19]